MSYIDNNQFEDRARLIGIGIVAVAALFMPTYALHLLGLDGVLQWLGSRSTAVQWGVLLPAWGISFVILLGIARGTMRFIGVLIPALFGIAERIGEATANALTAAAFGSGRLATEFLMLALLPLRCVWESARDSVTTRLGLYLQDWREEQELRRLYREEFRSEFSSFREFRQHFNNGGGAQADPNAGAKEQARDETPKADPFASACRLLGLPENGAFTAADLKKRFLALIKGVHPDVAGPNELAAQINAANSLIRKRKGWS